jgi:predicted dinucleotide-binding enzyme
LSSLSTRNSRMPPHSHKMRGLVATLLGLAAAALAVVSSDAASYQNAALPPKRAAAPSSLEPVAVVGTGKMGSAIAELLCAGGVPVHLVSRSPQKAKTAASAISSKARCHVTAAASPADALQSAGFVVLTSPFSGTADWLRANRAALIARDDRVVVDISNPWRSGEGIAPDAPILSGVELHQQALGHEGTQFVAAFKNNFAMRQLEHATGKNIVEFAADLAGDARVRFEKLMGSTKLKPVFRGEISKGAAATLEAEVRARACVRASPARRR